MLLAVDEQIGAMIWASQLALADAHQASSAPAPDWEVMIDAM